MNSCKKLCFPCSLPVMAICCSQTHLIRSVHWKQTERKAKEQIGWWSFRYTQGLWILNHPWICNVKTSKYRFASIPHSDCLTARDTNPAHGRKNESTAACQLRSPAWTLKQVRTHWVNGRTTFKQQLYSWHLFCNETTTCAWHLINGVLSYDFIIDHLWWQCCCQVEHGFWILVCPGTAFLLANQIEGYWNGYTLESSDNAFDGERYIRLILKVPNSSGIGFWKLDPEIFIGQMMLMSQCVKTLASFIYNFA